MYIFHVILRTNTDNLFPSYDYWVEICNGDFVFTFSYDPNF